MRIVIAEDDALLREGLALLLKAEGLDVIATAASVEELLTAVEEHVPDVAVIDLRMAPTHTDEGIRAAVLARQRQPGLAVLLLSAQPTSSRPSPPSCSRRGPPGWGTSSRNG